jgi:4-amino-4-deoxy-L-arabinose transferase-like glycosyltransferase
MRCIISGEPDFEINSMKLKLTFPWQIFLIALVLRLIPVLLTRSLGIGLDDMFQYDMLARSLASGNGFRWYAHEDLKLLEPYINFDLSSIDYDPVRGAPTSFRAPLYPAFLALIYFLTGSGAGRFFAVRLIQAGLGALLAPLTFHVSCRLFPNTRPASVISAWIIACYPLLIIYPIGLATENLFFLLVLAAFYFLLKLPNFQFPISDSLLSGLFLSLAALTRSVILPFAGLAVLWVWFGLKQKRAAILIALTILVVIAPWVIRNSLLHHKPTGIESSLGYNLYVGYHPESNGSFTFGPSLDLLSILDDAERDQVGIQKALEFIRAEPGRFLPLALNRLGFFFGLEKRALIYFYSNNLLGYISTPLFVTVSGIILLPFVFVATSAALGIGLTRLNRNTILLYLLLLAYILPHVFILSEDRFHLAMLPYLAVFAAQAWAGGLHEIVARWRESAVGKVAVILGVLVVFLLFLNWGFELSRDADKIAALLGPGGNRTHFPY